MKVWYNKQDERADRPPGWDREIVDPIFARRAQGQVFRYSVAWIFEKSRRGSPSCGCLFFVPGKKGAPAVQNPRAADRMVGGVGVFGSALWGNRTLN